MAKHNKIFTDEQHQFFIENNSKYYSDELAKLINDTFNLNITTKQIKNYRKNNKLPCKIDTRFEKGHKPYNKGKKFPGTANSGSYKKGHKSANTKPIGYIRKTKYGYRIKISDNPHKWESYNRYLWKRHYGEIAKNHTIIHKNKNRYDCRIENLMLVSRSELAVMNNVYKVSDNELITEVNNTLSKISLKLAEKKKKGTKK